MKKVNWSRYKSKPFIFRIIGTFCFLSLFLAVMSFAQEKGKEGSKAAPEKVVPSAGMPEKASAEGLQGGKAIYFKKCVWCHGPKGTGDGPAADRLWPRPRN